MCEVEGDSLDCVDGERWCFVMLSDSKVCAIVKYIHIASQLFVNNKREVSKAVLDRSSCVRN